jgi:hypothetical protein
MEGQRGGLSNESGSPPAIKHSRRDIGCKCGSPPETRCTSEGPNAGAADAAKFGVKPIESKQPKGAAPK